MNRNYLASECWWRARDEEVCAEREAELFRELHEGMEMVKRVRQVTLVMPEEGMGNA